MSVQVWTIGDNENGQQADGTDEDVEELQKINLNNSIYGNTQIINISTGVEGSTYILLNNGSIIVFGYDEYGQLGVDYNKVKKIVLYLYRATAINRILSIDIEILIITYCNKFDERAEEQTTPVLIDDFKVKHVSKGIASRHRFIITTDDCLYASGWNYHYQCGLLQNDKQRKFAKKNTEFNMWQKITYFKDNQIVLKQIECAWNYSLFLSIAGNMYTVGSSEYGVLGLDSNYSATTNITPIQIGGIEIESICCGMEHSLALTVKGDLMSWGWDNLGQRGWGGNKDEGEVKHVKESYSVGQDSNIIRYRDKVVHSEAAYIEYFMDNNIVITQIASGECHNMALDTEGKVYCWGRNKCFECGNGDNKNEGISTPELNQYLSLHDIVVIDVKCGAFHNVVKTKDDRYYLWGWNNYSQCLEYESEYCKSPHKLNIDSKKILGVYPGYNETRVVTNADLTEAEIDGEYPN